MDRFVMTRRGLLGSAAGTAGLLLLGDARLARTYAANDRGNLAHVGCGGRGRELIGSFANLGTIVAMCDVNDSRATEMYRKHPDVPKFRDYRRMLEAKGKEIDAVVVGVPDHSHAAVSAAAIRAGKHVYTEKPLTRLAHESRALAELARKHKVATSMGNQGTASGPYRRAVELIQAGKLGTIQAVYSFTDQGGLGWDKAPEGEQKIPAYLDWDLWLGPAASRPFHIKWMAWHFWRDFGTAQLGNWASHIANLPFRALKIDSLWQAGAAARPIRVEAKVAAVNRLGFPRWEHIQYHVPARGDLPPVTLHWMNGGGKEAHRAQLEQALGREIDWGDKGEKKWRDWAGCLIVGSEGKLYANAHNTTFTLLPQDKFAGVQTQSPERLERSSGHERDWLNACRGGKKPWANFDFAAPLTEFNVLGNVATQFEGAIEYDPAAGKIVNNAQADKCLTCEYRKGWSL